MLYQFADVLSPDLVAVCAGLLADPAQLVDGRRTAGWHARETKHNLQADDAKPDVQAALRQVENALERHAGFRAAARPRRIAKLMLSRYEPDMAYGAHVDDPIMAGARIDVSFTIALSPPDAYEGGALEIDLPGGPRAFRPAAGAMVAYPANTLHRVASVTSGVRLAIVGWAESRLRDPARRELLLDMDRAVQALQTGSDPARALELMLKARSNLFRMWMDD